LVVLPVTGYPLGAKGAAMEATTRWAHLFGRLLLAAIFLISALGKLANWHGTAVMAAGKGVPEILLAAATALEILGGLSVLSGFKARWGAVALIVFLVPVTLVFHNFWAVQGAQQQMQQVNFLKNVAICGGLFVVYAVGAGELSLDAWLARRAGHGGAELRQQHA
jgi:putative oxidoreductase